MTVEKTFQGTWRISDVVGGRFLTRQYFGYTKREAAKCFRQYVRAAIAAASTPNQE